jgi:hypothetical protein
MQGSHQVLLIFVVSKFPRREYDAHREWKASALKNWQTSEIELATDGFSCTDGFSGPGLDTPLSHDYNIALKCLYTHSS